MSFLIRPIEPEEYEAARALWDVVFPQDANGYSAYYFSVRTRAQNILAAFEGERMVGALHALPYPLRFGGRSVPTAMIAGVATLPEYRRRGIAAALIGAAHERLRAQGVVAALLKPDADIYARFGYVPFAYHDEYTLTASEAASLPASELHEAQADEMLAVYNAFAKAYAGMMARTQRDMEAYRREALLAGTALSDGQAYALVTPGNERAEVWELAGSMPEPLVRALALRYGEISFRLPASMRPAGLVPQSRMMFSMICPLDSAALLRQTGASDFGALLEGELGPCCTLEFC